MIEFQRRFPVRVTVSSRKFCVLVDGVNNVVSIKELCYSNALYGGGYYWKTRWHRSYHRKSAFDPFYTDVIITAKEQLQENKLL